jgi:D-alanine-D-alanine ligase
MADKKKIAVLMGGRSAERDVSLATGRQILESLDKEKYVSSGLDVDDLPRLATAAKDERPDVVFIALHGPGGEDGTVQGFLEVLGIPYTGSGVLASALAMDKVRYKALMGSENVILPIDIVFSKEDASRRRRAAQEIERDMGFPVVVKPSRQGSSYGTTVVTEAAQVADALTLVFKYDDTAIVEQKIEGTEITVGVIGNKELMALPIVEIIPPDENGLFDYVSKYSQDPEKAAREIVPANISDALAEEAKDIALRCHRLLDCRGMSRTDMFATDDGIITLETNTIPGMTPTSLLPKAAAAAGIPFPSLLDGLITLALEKRG